jgi:hypothetical protein
MGGVVRYALMLNYGEACVGSKFFCSLFYEILGLLETASIRKKLPLTKRGAKEEVPPKEGRRIDLGLAIANTPICGGGSSADESQRSFVPYVGNFLLV